MKSVVKPSKSIKQKIYIIPIVAITFYLLTFGLIYWFYIERDEKNFHSIKEDTYNSVVLKENIGEITKIKYDNFIKWIDRKEDYECIKFKIYTKDNVYKVCTIFKTFNSESHAIGYIVDNKIYMEDN